MPDGWKRCDRGYGCRDTGDESVPVDRLSDQQKECGYLQISAGGICGIESVSAKYMIRKRLPDRAASVCLNVLILIRIRCILDTLLL